MSKAGRTDAKVLRGSWERIHSEVTSCIHSLWITMCKSRLEVHLSFQCLIGKGFGGQMMFEIGRG